MAIPIDTKAHTIFVYGTLLSEEIVRILLKRYPEVREGLVSTLNLLAGQAVKLA